MKCPNPQCTATIAADAVFCGACGERVAPLGIAVAATMKPGLPTTALSKLPASSTLLATGTLFAKRYEIVRPVGAGGMGHVYLAKDQFLGTNVALKLLHRDVLKGPEAVARVAAEVETARQIRHPNIVAVHDIGKDNGQPYMSMEYVAGSTLRDWLGESIAAGRDVPVAVAIGLVKSMLAGLAEAHRMGVIHRDLKPENVLLPGNPFAQDFRLKILDFGIAKATAFTDGPRVSTAGQPLGTPFYMAPEQHTAAETVKPSADLYSVSVMLYELLMETPPQGNFELPGASRKDVPKALDEIIARGLKQRARDRFQSADEYMKALDAVMAAAPKSPSVTVRDKSITLPPPFKIQPPKLADQTIAKATLWRWLRWGIFVVFVIALGFYNIRNRTDHIYDPPKLPQLPVSTLPSGPQVPVKRPPWLPPGLALPVFGIQFSVLP